MKNLFYIALALLFSFSTHAQTTPAGENISLDQQLSAINQSTVTSGLIYERAVPIVNWYNFDQSQITAGFLSNETALFKKWCFDSS